MTPHATAQLVKRLAREVGFDLVGVTSPEPLARGGYYKDWLAAGYAGEMAFLARNVRFRLHPAGLLPGARSIICLAVNYARADAYIGPTRMRNPQVRAGIAPLPVATTQPEEHAASETRPRGLVAQYARGADYHTVLHRMQADLLARLRAALPVAFTARAFVDSGPLLERELAARAGLGWIGKNTCLLHPALGSYLFLGEIMTDLAVAADAPVTDHCANCRRCVAACPTGALVAPHELDARRCISYLTIEHRAEIAQEYHAAIGARVFGCDICQQVCPYNSHAPHGRQPEVVSESLHARPDLLELLQLTSGGYRRLVHNSAGRRASRAQWRRNANIALKNVSCFHEYT